MSEVLTLTLPPAPPETVVVELDGNDYLRISGCLICGDPARSRAVYDAIARGQRAESDGLLRTVLPAQYPTTLVDALLDAVDGCMAYQNEAVRSAYLALRPRVPESPPTEAKPPSPPVDARGNALRTPKRGEWAWVRAGEWFRWSPEFIPEPRWIAPGPSKPELPPVSCDYDDGAAARINAEIAAKAQTNTDAADLAEARRQRDEWKSLFNRVAAQADEWDRLYHEAANKRDAESARANRAEADLAAFRALGLTPDQLRLCMAYCHWVIRVSGLVHPVNSRICDESMHAPLLKAWEAEANR